MPTAIENKAMQLFKANPILRPRAAGCKDHVFLAMASAVFCVVMVTNCGC